ncbi:MAG: hypothetical protein SCALA702_23460 [Melioribacteraceae bacterium]|nr:MAG: hypothetical protein SCALA702_23460 [Melioribacteraceae bacterium]
MEIEELLEFTREDVSELSLKERAEALEKIMAAAEMLVEELGKMTLMEDIEFSDTE